VASTAILSPHRDDAVLSCWHALTQPAEVAVVNVFAGTPNGSVADAWWDRLTAGADPVERMRERADEDRAALARAGREPTDLPFLDQQYRDREQSLEDIVALLQDHVPVGARLLAPAALGGHLDHQLVRTAALELGAAGHEVALYADVPHATAYGWPAWVTGEPGASALDVDAYWDFHLRKSGLSLGDLEPELHRLEPADRERKEAAVRTYRTQFAALDRPFGLLTHPDVLRFEVVWRVQA